MAGLARHLKLGLLASWSEAICLADDVMIRQIFQDDSGLAILVVALNTTILYGA